uniref:Uncharacterized protein n=1 Tax=Populus alba TaxID=43335 RepID=A0A4U5PNF0_POPAL|nr:hypothetical protein D5086_0000214170 [Populus alba]
MFSWEFLRKSLELARRVLANQRTSTRALLKQSEGSNPLPVAASLSRSSFGGSNNGDLASGVVIVGSSLSFSYRYPSLVDKCSFVSFADSADDAAWVSSDDLLPHKKKKRFLLGAYEQIIQTFSIPGIGYSFVSFLSIVPDSYRRRVLFNYEKRIRLQSPPEKSNSNRIRDGLMNLFNINHVASHILLQKLVFLLGPFHVQRLDKLTEEFKKVMGLMRAQNRQGAGHRDGRRFGLKVAEPECHNIDSIADKFPFAVLLCSDESSILDSVHDHCLIVLVYNSQELNLLNFTDFTAGIISAKDFALSLVASADIRHISKLLDRVDEVSNEPQIRDIRITFEEFKNFAELRRQLQYLSLAIFSYGKVLTKKDFQRASSQVSD